MRRRGTFYFDRAVIQWAGFTVGRTLSFFDIFTTTEQYNYFEYQELRRYVQQCRRRCCATRPSSETACQRRSPPSRRTIWQVVVNGTAGGFSTNGVTNTALGTAGQNMPDIVGQLRIDQNWGYLGVSGAVHQVAGRYYNAIGPFTANNSAHPDDKYGWAAQIGGMLNLPWGDTIGASFVRHTGCNRICHQSRQLADTQR